MDETVLLFPVAYHAQNPLTVSLRLGTSLKISGKVKMIAAICAGTAAEFAFALIRILSVGD